jgi:hypothetical protein
LKQVTAILFSLILLFPSIGFSMVIDACCVTDFETCCSQDYNPTSCHETIDQDNCNDFVLIVLPPNQIDFTPQKPLNIPISLPIILKVKLHVLTNLCNRYRIVCSNYIDINSHPSIFQVFLC